MIEQVDHPVLWRQSIEGLLEAGFPNGTSAVEFGPGKVLTGLVKRIALPMGKTCALYQMSESWPISRRLKPRFPSHEAGNGESHPWTNLESPSRLSREPPAGSAPRSPHASRRDGFQVLINYTSNEAKANEVRTRIQAEGGKADLCQFDVASSAQVDEKFDWIAKTFGPLGCLVNNAGITVDSLLVRMKDEDLDRTLDIDLKGAIYCTRAACKADDARAQGQHYPSFVRDR